MIENNQHTSRTAQPAMRNDTITRAPFSGSLKIHVRGALFEDVRVPMREIRLSSAAAEDARPADSPETLTVYDTSGPYTDPAARIDVSRGLEPRRLHWILERGDVEQLEGPSVPVARGGQLSQGSVPG